MKEGLRSGKLYAKGESSKVSPNQVEFERKGHEENHVSSESGVEKPTDLVSCGPEPEDLQLQEKSDELGNEEFEEGDGPGDGDDDDGGCEKVEVADNGRKRKNMDGGADIGNDGIGKKKVKEEELNEKLQVGRRVLRSTLLANGGCDEAEVKDILDWKSGEESEERKVKCDQLISGLSTKSERKRGRPPLAKKIEGDASGLKKLKGKRGRPRKVENEEHVLVASDGGLRKKLKGKRGRPRKVQESSCKALNLNCGRPPKLQESNGVLKRKRGRPPKTQERNGALKLKLGRPCKVEKQEHNQLLSDGQFKELRPKRGRPPKVQESNEAQCGAEDKSNLKLHPGNTILPSRLRARMNHNVPAYISHQERMLIGKELNMKKFLWAKKNKIGADSDTKENEASSGKRPKKVNAFSLRNPKGKITKKDGELEPHKSEAKQSVREKIIELLLSAGWTIEHRPRLGRDYSDSVYVSLEGRTHWSVTLAYNVLRKHYEDGDGESKVYRAGFKFIPIPEEEISILKRVILKKREGKRKLKPTEGNSEKKRKKKLLGRSVRGRLKGKPLLYRRENLVCTQHNGMQISVRDYDQQETQNRKRRTLLVRNSMEEADLDADGYIPYEGKRTVLAWMIDLRTVTFNEKVHYMNQRKKRVLLEGRITRDGILCDCCSETLTVLQFGTHAGDKHCDPFKNICLDSGTSLLQCLLDSWNKQEESKCKGFQYIDINGEDPNDDTCGICGDGGDLICCDGCPSTFHQSCLDIQKFPPGDWNCVYCSCKFCGMAGGNECKQDDNDDLAALELLTCQLCEKKYHQFCSNEKDAGYDHSSCSSFCGKKCQEIFEKLRIVLGVQHDLEEGFSWTLIHRSDVCDIPQICDEAQKIECNSKLAVALSIMDECFLPIVDHRSGINLIHNIVYNFGSNFNRLNYSGFFTAILERGDEIVCAASIRIHGDQLAEMPFIGTRYMYRRQGMCRRLLSAIESALCSLDVERLVIPAISELRETWTSVFGFRPLEASKQKMKNINMLVFPGVQMLQKPLLKLQMAEENMIALEGSRPTELEEQCAKKEVLCKSDDTCIKGSVSNISGEAIAADGANINESTVESNVQLPDDLLNNADKKCLTLFNIACDNLEGENKTIVNLEGSTCGFHEKTEDISKYQNDFVGSTSPVLVQRAVGLGSQPNQRSISEEESKSLVLPCTEFEVPTSGRLVLSAPRESTESADCEVKLEDCIVTENLNSQDEGIRHSSEINTMEPPEKTFLNELEVSVNNVVCHDSEISVQISNGDGDFKSRDSECHLEEKMLQIHEMQNDCAAAVQKAEDDLKESQRPEPLDCSYSSLQGSGLETHELLSAPVDSNCDSSCGAFLESNGLCKSKEVMSGSLGVMVDGIQD